MQATPAAPIGPQRPQRSASRARLAFFPAKGSSAPSLRRLSLAPLLALAATLALGAASASAATPTLTLEPVTNVAITNAEVHGSVDPGTEFTTYYIQFTTQAAYEAEGFGPETQSPVIEGIEGSGPQPVGGVIGPMHPNTTYRLRLYAENGSGHEEIVEAATFTTKPAIAPALHLNAPTEASYQRVHLSATIDPEGGNANPGEPEALPIQWQFQVQKASEPETWQFAGAGVIEGAQAESNSPIEVPADPTGLSPETEYQARILVTYVGSEQLIGAEEPSFETLPVAKPIVTMNPVGAITATTAHFSGEVNPNAPKEAAETSEAEQEAFLTHWRFECAPECPGLEGEVQADDAPNEVSAEATGLTPGTSYVLSLIAENAGGATIVRDEDFTFATEAVQPQIDATFATAVSEEEATLGAKINPGGAVTTFHFEYLTQAQFEAEGGFSSPETKKAPEPDGAAGSNYEDHTVEATISGLTPDTAYRYRVVATNEKALAGLPGSTKGFTTTSPAQGFGGKCPANEQLRRENNSTALPDCRAYEMVSPVDKGGNDAVSRNPSFVSPAQSSPGGEGVAYMGTGPFPGAAGSYALDLHVSSRGASGWSTSDLAPPTPAGSPPGAVTIGYDLSEDLSTVAIKVLGGPLAPGAPSGFERVTNLFLRHPGGAFSLLDSLPPTSFPEADCEVCTTFEDVSAFAGASADFTHVLFEANDTLEGTGAPTFAGPFEGANLYEDAGGSVRLVGFLPDGTAAPGGAGPGVGGSWLSVTYSSLVPSRWGRVEHAISADGSKVIFSAASDEGEPDEAGQNGMTELYDRIEADHTIELSAPNPAATPENPAAAPAAFWATSKDGSRVYFTSCAQLTSDSTATPSPGCSVGEEEPVAFGNDLYEYDFEKPASERLTDLSVDAAPPGADVLGVVDAADDGSYVYFVAKGQLDGSEGVEGQPNLYVSHEGGAPLFIATLSPADENDWTPTPHFLQAYVSPDGAHLAFMSRAALTGYDNTDQGTGQPDAEVYEWSAGSQELTCVSCDPTGQRPTAGSFLGAAPQFQFRASTPFHQPRVMSDDGTRVFFSSPDRLVPGAAGSNVKIYEHEQDATGSCARQGGCLFLISSPAGSADSTFLDAGADGRDVFFTTLDRLTPTDAERLNDVYDARVGGGFPAPPPKPECEAEACRGPGTNPPPVSPKGTNTFTGSEEGPRHPRCAKGKVKRHGVCHERNKRKKHKHRAKKHQQKGSVHP